MRTAAIRVAFGDSTEARKTVSILIRKAIPADIPSITSIYRHAVIHGTASFELDPPNEAEMLGRYEAIKNQDWK